MFHLLDVAFQFSSGNLKVGLDFVNVVLQFGPEFLKFVVECKFKVFFSDQTFIEIGLSFGEDFGLVLTAVP